MYISSENVYFIDIPLSGYLLSMNEVKILGFGAAVLSLRNMYVIIKDGEGNWAGFHNRLLIVKPTEKLG